MRIRSGVQAPVEVLSNLRALASVCRSNGLTSVSEFDMLYGARGCSSYELVSASELGMLCRAGG